ncbi:pyridoxamine 5'-phosphate oxidase family protein [Lacunimicrobium album]
MSTQTIKEFQKFHDVMEKFDSAMLVSRTLDGELRSRPMVIAKVENDCRLWFITNLYSGKVEEFLEDPHVNVALQNGSQYVSLSGEATIDRNRAKLDEFWNESWKTWFPGGKDDPELALIGVEPDQGQYWDNSGTSGMKYLYEASKAYFSGTKPEIDEDIHGSVDFREPLN